jgi:uncharacterized protein YjiK
LAILVGLTSCASVHGVDLRFDDIGGTGVRAVASDRYVADGVRLETNGAGFFVFGPSPAAVSSPDWLYGSQSPAGGNADANITLRFVSPADGMPALSDDVAFSIADADHVGAWLVQGFNAQNQAIALVTGTGASHVRLTGKPFQRVEFTPSGDFDGIDSLTFNEPFATGTIGFWTPVAFGHSWRYLHPLNNVDPATTDTDFRTTWFRNDGSYNGPAFSGPGRSPLGYGALDLRPLVTNIGTPASGQRHSAYFTTTFEVANASLVRTLSLDLLADDGAFIYLNGQLVARHNVAATATDTFRQAALGIDIAGISTELAAFTVFLDPSALVTGTNFLAVSLHNDSPTSSDLGFDLQLSASMQIVPEPSGGVLAIVGAVALWIAFNRCRAGRSLILLAAGLLLNTWIDAARAQAPAMLSSPFYLLDSRPRMAVPNGPALGNFSGVAFNPVTNSLFVVDNGVSHVYEYDLTGAHRRTITTTGFDDTEGIYWLGGDRFALLEEKTTHINLITIDATTTAITKSSLPAPDVIRPDLVPGDPGLGSLNPTGLNTGLEGVAFDAARNVYYVTKEKSEGTPGDHSVNIFAVAPDGVATVLFNPSVRHGASPTSLTGVATDIADIHYDPRTEHLIVLSQESRRLIEVTLAGEVIRTRTQPGTQAEGITFTPDGRDLYVVGENREFFHYQSSPDLAALVASGARWKYRDNGSNQGDAWRTATFDDSTWAQGPTEMGYGDSDEVTTVDCGPVAACTSQNYATTYFRHAFEATDAHRIDELSLGIQRDDAAAVYLNGVQIYRDSNLPANALFNQFSGGTALSDPDEDFFVHVAVDPILLSSGRNVLAVEVHQISATDSDISFNAQLIARYHPIPEPATDWLAVLGILVLGFRVSARGKRLEIGNRKLG